jgi:predicted chitinase
MTFPLDAAAISRILGPFGPLANVTANWPLVEAALDRREIYSPPTAVAAIATIGVECGNFYPVKERGGPAYLTDLYEGRADLGNCHVGDGVRYRGRGFVQITGRANYTHFGAELGRDLAANPDLALDPAIAAEVLALFFHERKIPQFAEAGQWEMVRRRVNGGMNAWPKFIGFVDGLLAALNNSPVSTGQEATR